MTETESESPFDFAAHGNSAVARYLPRQAFYGDLASVVKRIVMESLDRRGIKVQSVEARPKDAASLSKKAAQPSESDPSMPKYPDPLAQITDLAGIRIITYFPGTLTEIDQLLQHEFDVVERSDKGAELVQEDRFGYQSVHYLVRISQQRAALPEYQRFGNSITEVQVRTILQHAWAEIEHDIQYKSASVIPTEIRRRFGSLAGMLEMADREFQAIQDEDRALAEEARARVEGGQLEDVEITPDSLKAFLDKRLGPDGRISDFSYDWEARLLKRLGFRTLEQVSKTIAEYDDDELSRIAEGSRQGQTTRFELMLLAGMGERYIDRHPWSSMAWFRDRHAVHLQEFRDAGAEIQDYDPRDDGTANSPSERPM